MDQPRLMPLQPGPVGGDGLGEAAAGAELHVGGGDADPLRRIGLHHDPLQAGAFAQAQRQVGGGHIGALPLVGLQQHGARAGRDVDDEFAGVRARAGRDQAQGDGLAVGQMQRRSLAAPVEHPDLAVGGDARQRPGPGRGALAGRRRQGADGGAQVGPAPRLVAAVGQQRDVGGADRLGQVRAGRVRRLGLDTRDRGADLRVVGGRGDLQGERAHAASFAAYLS